MYVLQGKLDSSAHIDPEKDSRIARGIAVNDRLLELEEGDVEDGDLDGPLELEREMELELEREHERTPGFELHGIENLVI